LTRRQIAAQQREANVQRRVIFVIGGVLGLVLLLIITGIVYDRLYLPSLTLKEVNNAKLTRAEYEKLRRASTIEQMIQILQFSKLFGANQSFGQGGRFDEQVVAANVSLSEIGTSRDRQEPVDESLVTEWTDRQILEQGAQQQFSISPEQGAIDQLIVAQLGSLIETTPPLTATSETTATDTTAASEAATAEPTAAVTGTAATEASPAGIAATTPTATTLPTATPLPDEATQKVAQIVDALYTEYTNILEALPEGAIERQRTPQVAKEEFASTLRTQYRSQLLEQRVGEALLKELPSNDTAEPEQINVRHILLQVPKPSPTPSPEPLPEETAEASATSTTPEPTQTPTQVPTPTPTPSPEELDKLFAERKQEADTLYQQLIKQPDSFAEVARAQSEDQGSAPQGGDLGAIDREGNVVGQQGQTLVQPFVEGAWKLKENEISQPVRTEFGWHIIQRVPEDPQAKLERLRREAYQEWFEQQRQQATIVPAPTPTATQPPLPTPEAPAEPDGVDTTPTATE